MCMRFYISIARWTSNPGSGGRSCGPQPCGEPALPGQLHEGKPYTTSPVEVPMYTRPWLMTGPLYVFPGRVTFQSSRPVAAIVRTQDPDRLGHEDDATRGRGGGERSSRGLARGRCGPVCSSVRGPRRSSSCWFPPSKFEQQNGSGSFRAPAGHIPGNAASRQTRLAESSGPTPTFPVSR